MMKSVLPILTLLSIAMLHTMIGRAQYVAEPVEDEFPYKHQIGVALTPFAMRLIGGIPSRQKYALVWRKRTDLSRNFRLAVAMTNLHPVVEDPKRLHALNDSGAVMVSNRLRDLTFDLRGGLEWFKFGQSHGAVFGVDLIAGMRTMKRERDYYFEPLDSLSSNNTGLEIENYQPADRSDLKIAVGGLAANFGYALHAGQHFIFHFVWSPQLIYLLPISETYSDITFSQERFNRGLILDFSYLEFYLSRKF